MEEQEIRDVSEHERRTVYSEISFILFIYLSGTE